MDASALNGAAGNPFHQLVGEQEIDNNNGNQRYHYCSKGNVHIFDKFIQIVINGQRKCSDIFSAQKNHGHIEIIPLADCGD